MLRNVITTTLLVTLALSLLLGCQSGAPRLAPPPSTSQSAGWEQVAIPLPDGSGSVYYMVQLQQSLCAEYDRKARVQTTRVHGKVHWLPMDTAGGSPVNVYWYPAERGRGPYLRFRDPLQEYLVDVSSGTTLLVVRVPGAGTYAGEIRSNRLSSSVSSMGSPPRDVEVMVCDRPAHKLDSRIADKPGQYIGRVDESYRRFVSRGDAPEQQIKVLCPPSAAPTPP